MSTIQKIAAGLWKRIQKAHRSCLVYVTNHIIAGLISRRMRLFWYRYVMRFQLGQGTSVLPDFRISEPGNLVVGDHSVINNSCRFDNREPISIGNNVSVSYGSMLLTRGHNIDDPSFGTCGAGIRIDDYAWICANAVILPGVTIGKGAVVLTGSVVTKDVSPFAVVGGNPAQFIRERGRDLQYELNWNPRVPFFG